jgi:uncharacterized protein YecE (DUF72 family)
MTSGKFYCGTSGLVLPVPNKQAFPEAYRQGTRLTYYASLFNSLEVNSSFYKIPRAATLAKWETEVPEDFRFTMKLWRGITHVPGLTFDPGDVGRFLQAASGMGHKKGCLLVQLPPALKVIGMEPLERLLERIAGHGWKLAVEFRDKSWYTMSTDHLLERFDAVRVLQDMPDSFNWEPMTNGAVIYMRYHGEAGDYRGSYQQARLIKDASLAKIGLQSGKDVYVYFNNTIGDAVANAQSISSLPADGGER